MTLHRWNKRKLLFALVHKWLAPQWHLQKMAQLLWLDCILLKVGKLKMFTVLKDRTSMYLCVLLCVNVCVVTLGLTLWWHTAKGPFVSSRMPQCAELSYSPCSSSSQPGMVVLGFLLHLSTETVTYRSVLCISLLCQDQRLAAWFKWFQWFKSGRLQMIQPRCGSQFEPINHIKMQSKHQ